jgi:uncharacterized membrane protein YhaH (DUF805 family)
MQFDWKRLYLSADGRIGRQEFWIGFAILFAIGVVLGWIPFVGFLVGLACAYAQVCLGSKRLHDFGKSGWLMGVPYAVVLVCIIIAMIGGGMAMMGASMSGNNGAVAGASALAGLGMLAGVFGLAAIVNIAFLLWVGLTPSQPGENRYGPEPVTAPLPGATPPTTPV